MMERYLTRLFSTWTGISRTSKIKRNIRNFYYISKVFPSQVNQFHSTSQCENTESNELPAIVSSTKSKTRSEEKIQKISRAMQTYMQRAKDHESFIKEQVEDFEMGRRHLANMMGLEADQMTKKDINEAIEYLMPSGLFDKKARPFMKHPDEVFPKQKAAEFDISGRPFHFLFYTGNAAYYQALHDVAGKLEALDAFEDQMIRQGILKPHSELKLILTGSEWMSLEELKKKLVENIKDAQYDYFVASVTRLADHPYAYREKDFIMSFRKILVSGVTELNIPPLLMDDNGRQYASAQGTRKKTKATVTVRGNGCGIVNINGKDVRYFDSFQDREQILFPLQFTGLLGKVDIEAQTDGTGHSSQAGAIRYAMSSALMSFVDKHTVENMRIAGLLTRDPRIAERKKYGQKGARAKYTWKKR